MKLMNVVFLLIICFVSCSNEHTKNKSSAKIDEIIFDKVKWQIKEEGNYVYRINMYKNILYNKEIREMRKEEVLGMLGEAERNELNHYYYTITQDRIGLLPLHTKTMVVKFTNENKIDWIKIHE